MVQSVKYWLCKHEDLRLAFQHPFKLLDAVVPMCNPITGEAETGRFLRLIGIQSSLRDELQVQGDVLTQR